uniref:Translation initiation factor 1 n=1 Tax=Sorbus filipes TaxID=2992296 RepID=A0A9E8IDB8_9ROSA|nr:translation initiation factor 1 [Sorbus hupehensis]YP_010570160.1 translation initiation factor 1 [Sorbus multijuga]UZF97739.1 translation initiation factor 1 [Sorbus hupehensis]UZF97992.1 translation initiation factor 1 [Sorbus multijuga]UZF98245.1 translation initiation factor 1 [Sorbus filipes]
MVCIFRIRLDNKKIILVFVS